MQLDEPNLHIVLVRPEIPQNTGSIARLAAAIKARLHLIGPLGFSLEDRYLKRAGLDYWPLVDLQTYKGWDQFAEHITIRREQNRNSFRRTGRRRISMRTTSAEISCSSAARPQAWQRVPVGENRSGLSDTNLRGRRAQPQSFERGINRGV